jgi:glutaredoxin
VLAALCSGRCARFLVGCLAVVAPLAPAPKRTVARRAALLGFSSAAVLAPAAARAEDLLEAAGKLVTVLKPLYGFEAPLQAGAYDKAAVRARIERDVRSGPVVVYSYTLSPFCTEAKALLAAQGAKVTVIELGDEWVPGLLPAGGAAVRAELGAMTGQTSMPHVFIGGASIGGLASGTPGLKALLRDGSLRDKLKAAGAL